MFPNNPVSNMITNIMEEKDQRKFKQTDEDQQLINLNEGNQFRGYNQFYDEPRESDKQIYEQMGQLQAMRSKKEMELQELLE